MRRFLAAILRSVRSDAWTRRQMIRDVGLRKWLVYEWGFVKFIWAQGHERVLERSEMTVAAVFQELRVNLDVTGTATRWDLIEFARLSGCEDLMEEARMSAEEYQLHVESRGGLYPLEGLRQTFAGLG